MLALAVVLPSLGNEHAASANGQQKAGQESKILRFQNAVPGVAYVGSKACSKCHADIYNHYIETDMGRSMSLVSEPTQLEKVSSPVTVFDKRPNRYFQVFREGSNLYQSEYELGPDGREIFRDTQKIEYAVGSGVNGTSYIVRRGDFLFEAPLTYYSRKNAWDLSPGYELENYVFSRPILAGCVACHSGFARPVPEGNGQFRDPPFGELAIGCENCHGPGQLHVVERMRGAPVSDIVDQTIVNPAKLPGWLADNICMYCHQTGDTRVLQPGKDYSDFRPGTPLDNTLAIFSAPFSRQSLPADPLLQHYTMMILSKCYRQDGGRLSCITCHNPHEQPSRSEIPVYYRARCLACHKSYSCKLPLVRRLTRTPADDCTVCHMPKQNLKLISHASLTNHRIITYEGERYPESAFRQTTPQLPDLIHINAIPGAETLPIKPLVLFQAYGELMRYHPNYGARFREQLDQVARIEPDNVYVLSALARKILLEGTTEANLEAKRYLSRSIELGSKLIPDYELLADLLSRSGQIAEAIKILKRAVELAPYSGQPYDALAHAYFCAHQYSASLRVVRKGLELFPGDPSLRLLQRRLEQLGSH